MSSNWSRSRTASFCHISGCSSETGPCGSSMCRRSVRRTPSIWSPSWVAVSPEGGLPAADLAEQLALGGGGVDADHPICQKWSMTVGPAIPPASIHLFEELVKELQRRCRRSQFIADPAIDHHEHHPHR